MPRFDAVTIAPAVICVVAGCERPRYGRGWCKGHYRRWQRTGTPGTRPLDWRTHPPEAVCAVPGCGRPRWNRRWCTAHYFRLRRTDTVAAAVPIRAPGGALLDPASIRRLRVAGHSEREIARLLGCSRSGVNAVLAGHRHRQTPAHEGTTR